MTRPAWTRLSLRLLLLFCLAAAICFAQEQAGGSAGEGEFGGIWKWLNFLILAGGLGYLMAKYLPAYFRSRTEAIEKGIAEAQKLKLDAERRAADMEKRMGALETEVDAFRAEAHDEMELEGERIRRETAAQIRKLEQQAEVEIEAAGKAAQRELRAYAADLAMDLAEKRIQARLDDQTRAGLVENFVGDLKRQESKN
jgi:F-type H+-transporting ATPase subunit b